MKKITKNSKYQILPTLINELVDKSMPYPNRVSIYGAAPPGPSGTYKIVTTGYSLQNLRTRAISNYFYGKIIKTKQEAKDVIKRLTNQEN